ncbi:hypothetical protein MKQ70_20150 [Chitinophaga sedimenti]|uniref:hypothetical protein n=1 Tax=Chitinophaga sedimenti TaxID=2033606 RepID=UPI002003284C|nr:hypothetical protein [Chitinophaga sedimenti]MCK7557190.1 hypothetical protein [Chitinophaga sedimenti]
MEQQSVNGSGLSDQEKESCLEKGERIARLEKAREHHPNTNGSEPAKEDTLIGILEGRIQHLSRNWPTSGKLIPTNWRT